LINRRSDELIDVQHGQSTNDRNESDRDSEDSVTTSETAGRTNICTPIEQLSLRLMSDDNAADVELAETIPVWDDGQQSSVTATPTWQHIEQHDEPPTRRSPVAFLPPLLTYQGRDGNDGENELSRGYRQQLKH
jgi:hypothetical protein